MSNPQFSVAPRLRVFFRAALLLSAPSLLGVSAAWALDPASVGDAAREAQRIQRDDQIRQQQEFEKSRSSSRAPARLAAPPPERPVATPTGSCRQIETVVLDGASLLDVKDREILLKPYEQHCLGVAEIEALLADITRIYIKRGYIAARAYVPPQDMSKGRLDIRVVEGKVSAITLENASGEEKADAAGNESGADKKEGASMQKESPAKIRPIYFGNIFPGVIGDPLNLRDIEQGLDQLNRLSSHNAAMDIRQGEQPGDSIIVVHDTPSKRWHGSVNADNQSSRSIGRNQAAVTLSLDSPFGINDFISATRRQAVPDEDGRGSSSENYSYVLPFGYHTFSSGYSNSRYESTLHTAGGIDLQSAGDTHNLFLRDDFVAWRGQSGRLLLSAALTRKDNKSYLAEQLLAVSSRRLAVLDLGGSLNTAWAGGVFGLDLGVSAGLRGLGALEDQEGLPKDAPRAQFRKITYGLSYSHPFHLAGLDASVSSQLNGQHGIDPLYGSEQIGIGGIYSVRGFYETSIAGDSGYYLRNEASVQKPAGRLFGKLLMLKPYLALDVGDARSAVAATPAGTLAGAAVGLTAYSGPLFMDVMAGHPVYQSDVLGSEEGSSAFFRFSWAF